MAAARKCDRCGKYFDKNEEWKYNGQIITGITFDFRSSHSSIEYDLCDSCLSKLRFFLEHPEAELITNGDVDKED